MAPTRRTDAQGRRNISESSQRISKRSSLVKSRSAHADSKHIERHYHVLCRQIGKRLCGSDGERRAADYIASTWDTFRLQDVRLECFRFPDCQIRKTSLWVGGKNPSRRLACGPMVYSPPTRPAGVRGPLIFLQGGHPFDFDGNLKGKIGLLTGSLSLQEPTLKRCIVESGLRGLIVVDNRLVHGLTYPAGAAPQWVGEYTVPTVTLPLTAALELVRNLPLHAKINVDSQFSDGRKSERRGRNSGKPMAQ